MAIYGSAYILTADGQYLFGEAVSRSLRDVVIGVDGMWSKLNALQQDAILDMYKTYEADMKTWGLTNIMAAAK